MNLLKPEMRAKKLGPHQEPCCDVRYRTSGIPPREKDHLVALHRLQTLHILHYGVGHPQDYDGFHYIQIILDHSDPFVQVVAKMMQKALAPDRI